MNTSIKTFHNDHYGPSRNKLHFHLPHVTTLGTNYCGDKRCEYFEIIEILMHLNSFHYYMERLSFQFFNQIQSENYGIHRLFLQKNSSVKKKLLDSK